MLAYLDPFSGSIIVQVLIASGVATSFFFKNAWAKAASFIAWMFRRKPTPDDPGSGSE